MERKGALRNKFSPFLFLLKIIICCQRNLHGRRRVEALKSGNKSLSLTQTLTHFTLITYCNNNLISAKHKTKMTCFLSTLSLQTISTLRAVSTDVLGQWVDSNTKVMFRARQALSATIQHSEMFCSKHYSQP